MTDSAQTKTPYILTDVDGTLIRWQLFHRLVEEMVVQGLQQRVVLTRIEESLNGYKDREASFKRFADTAVEAYQGGGRMRGIRLDDLEIVAREIIRKEGKRVHVFTRELLAAGKDCGYGTAFISGSPVQVVHQLALHYDVDAWLGTEHPHENGVFTGEKQHEWVADKREAVRHLEELRGIDRPSSVAIGDSESDIPMLKMVGYPLVFNPNEGLYRAAQANHWPVFIEKKLVYVERFLNGSETRGSTVLKEVLPVPLAEALQARLTAQGILA